MEHHGGSRCGGDQAGGAGEPRNAETINAFGEDDREGDGDGSTGQSGAKGSWDTID